MSYPHPFFDYKVDELATVTRLDDPCIYLSEGIADLIHAVRNTTQKQIIITVPQGARLTPAFDRVAYDTGCTVLVREPTGFRDARNGRWTPQIELVVQNPNDPRIVLSENHFQPAELVPLLTVSASIYHPARGGTVIGRVAELLCLGLLPEDTVLGWGRYEPAGAPWDRKQLTKDARDRMPHALFTISAHSDTGAIATGTLTISRSENGLEEYLEVNVNPKHWRADEWHERTTNFLNAIGNELKPQFALAYRTGGLADGSVPTTARPAPTPVAVLIGAPGVKQLGVDAQEVAQQHGGMTTGHGRRQGILVPLKASTAGDWSTLGKLVETLDGGTGKVARVLAETGASTQKKR
ncbi:Uncharacterised protein [Actinomyces bovis]|uniref:Uncharacterized protein n=1 Tax=Actinomyces bovis TaxID=1658 RepID=A0ABY1VQC6_9ACTO|nr:DUF6177 family protein [Actinomyces bovis]SPT54326.1 Uncharacterised protein [Actinomyces bovis]VEG56295.1 Uncharacterised protein [Actinomyces israelii]